MRRNSRRRAARLETLGEKMPPVLDAYSEQPQLAERFVRQVKRR